MSAPFNSVVDGKKISEGKIEAVKQSEKNSPTQNRESFPIVGIGASAGGLEAITLILQHLELDTGLVFVFI